MANKQPLTAYSKATLSRDYAKRLGYEIVELVYYDVVYFRDKGTCWRCNAPVDASKVWPDNWCGTLDHTEPIHSYSTVKLAHHECNARASRGAKGKKRSPEFKARLSAIATARWAKIKAEGRGGF
jgi:hypothetical protein